MNPMIKVVKWDYKPILTRIWSTAEKNYIKAWSKLTVS